MAADGGVFTFGHARYFGSLGNTNAAAPIVGMLPTLSGKGYWIQLADGQVAGFGDAHF